MATRKKRGGRSSLPRSSKPRGSRHLPTLSLDVSLAVWGLGFSIDQVTEMAEIIYQSRKSKIQIDTGDGDRLVVTCRGTSITFRLESELGKYHG